MIQTVEIGHCGGVARPVVHIFKGLRFTRKVAAGVAEVVTIVAPVPTHRHHDLVQVGDEHICRRCYRLIA
jgi:hypothetical protein